MSTTVTVITGIGGMGRAIARRLGSGSTLILAAPGAILAVDLLGTATMLDAFAKVIAAGGYGGLIASMAGHLATLPPEVEQALSATPTADLLALPFLSPQAITTSAAAYSVAKRANQLRVAAAAHGWGQRGARVNSISPGIIATPMGQAELANSAGQAMRAMIAASPAARTGTAEDVAAAADFLTGPHATFITGTDLLVDGGVVAAYRNGRVNLSGL